MGLIYLDACVLIYVVERSLLYGERVLQALDRKAAAGVDEHAAVPQVVVDLALLEQREPREGLARLVSNIAIANIDSLARENDPQQLKDRLDYDDRLEGVRQMALTIVETVTETQLANGIDIMNLVDAFAANLQTSRSGNGSLDEAMKGVDEYNKRFAPKGEVPNP